MKKSLLSVLAVVIIVFTGTSLFSQSAYIKLGGGYGLGLSEKIREYPTTSGNTTALYGSYGEGANFQAGFGYNLNPSIALELAGSYTLGKKHEYSYSASPTVTYLEKYYSNTVSIMPSVIVKLPMKDMTPYTRFGMVIGIPSKQEDITASGTGAPVGTRTYKETGGMGLGFQGAFGINFKAGKNLGIFAEIFGVGMNYAPSKLENTSAFTGETLDPTITYSESFSTGAANTDITPRYSFSSYGLNVGLTYTFGK